MRMTNPPFYPAAQYQRLSNQGLSLIESLRIYFTILSGVAVLALSYYYVHVTPFGF